jgi:hypothetical protein
LLIIIKSKVKEFKVLRLGFLVGALALLVEVRALYFTNVTRYSTVMKEFAID